MQTLSVETKTHYRQRINTGCLCQKSALCNIKEASLWATHEVKLYNRQQIENIMSGHAIVVYIISCVQEKSSRERSFLHPSL